MFLCGKVKHPPTVCFQGPWRSNPLAIKSIKSNDLAVDGHPVSGMGGTVPT